MEPVSPQIIIKSVEKANNMKAKRKLDRRAVALKSRSVVDAKQDIMRL
jgi:hypothetical protein